MTCALPSKRMPVKFVPAPDPASATCQALFHQRWRHLRDRHVRDLAWLLDAPDLLDPDAPQWEGKIAALPSDAADRAAAWLAEQDAMPQQFHAYLEIGRFTRLGRYAEKLMAFYFRAQGTLAAHGLQVRAGPGATVGEFDFLLHDGSSLVHWELATKFYLLAVDGRDAAADYFVGPNLADTLQAKMHKILRRQLALATHPATQALLPAPIVSSHAFIKGWLFSPGDYAESCMSAGVSSRHCRGRWLPHEAFIPHPGLRFMVLPRLRWLAPAQVELHETLDGGTLLSTLADSFLAEDAPVMVASLCCDDQNLWRETERAFIVPNDWRARALRKTMNEVPEG
jgi:hypothetical protein